MWAYLLTALGVSIFINVAMFVVAFRRGTDKLTDASYAVSFVALAIYGLARTPISPFKIILVSMITVWAARLGGFLLFRIWRTGKDSRFDAMRGNFWKFGKFWISQALAVWVILIPSLLALCYEHTSLTMGAATGAILWFLGLGIESLADLQKYRFSRNPKNKDKWIDVGIWHFSRHPNYFGEITVWAGVYFFASSILSPVEMLVGLVSPLFITTLLLFVSGMPILEKSADARWGKQKAYQDYKARTSILLPWPPKRP